MTRSSPSTYNAKLSSISANHPPIRSHAQKSSEISVATSGFMSRVAEVQRTTAPTEQVVCRLRNQKERFVRVQMNASA